MSREAELTPTAGVANEVAIRDIATIVADAV